MRQMIIHACGHEVAHDLFGMFAVDYDRQADRHARRKCFACSAVADAARLDRAKATAAAGSFVPLAGSVRQVAWAEAIRVKRLASLRAHDSVAATILAKVADARWWIEQRALPDEALITLARTSNPVGMQRSDR